MKIRTAFVSNSSSASYIVNIKGLSLEKFIEDMTEEFCFSYFEINSIIKDLKKNIKWRKEAFKDFCGIGVSCILEKEKALLKSLEEYKLNKEQSQTEDPRMGIRDPELIRQLLKDHYGIGCVGSKKAVSLHSFTPMHNDISDVPEILRNIIVFYAFQNKRIECEIDGDGE